MLTQDQVWHDSQDINYRSPVGAAEAGSKVRMSLRLRTKEGIRQVILRCWQDQTGEYLIPLETKDDPFQEEHLYSGWLPLPEKGGLVWYYFIISMEDGTWYYGNNPEQLGGMGTLYDHVPPSFQITVFNKGAKTPDWFKHAVMYQIFPDRFSREGNTIIEKKGAVFHACWQDDPCYYKDPDTKEIVAYDFFGGNLKGIEKKLDYLKDLGISVIYLNPVFESESNHHYDTGDYHKIDPILGSNEDFRHLVDTAKAKGIRIILDGVFSHTGSNSRYFNREGQYNTIGAFQSPDSPYYEWYNFRNFPYEYESWWNFSTLPDVKETTPSYMDFIIYDKDSVMHHWMKEGIAGWRLDVIDELPAAFSQAFFAELKKTNPDAVMIGEVWEDASHKVAYGVPREYLCGQEMDSAMNYPFRQILFDFLLGRTDARMSLRRFESLRENYPRENFYAMMNLIGSHDVERAITVLGEEPFYDGMPAIEQSRARLSDDQYNLGMARLFMAALWQMTYPGVPCVYYGDEIAMQGFKDPYNRRPYDWEHGDTYVRSRYERMIRVRNEHTALQTGELLPLYAEGDVMAFARLVRGGRDVFGEPAKDECFISLFNRSLKEKKTVTLQVGDFADGVFADAFHPETRFTVENGQLTVTLLPLKGFLLQSTVTSMRLASCCTRRRCRRNTVSATSARRHTASSTSSKKRASTSGRSCRSARSASAIRRTSPRRPLRATRCSSTSMSSSRRAGSASRRPRSLTRTSTRRPTSSRRAPSRTSACARHMRHSSAMQRPRRTTRHSAARKPTGSTTTRCSRRRSGTSTTRAGWTGRRTSRSASLPLSPRSKSAWPRTSRCRSSCSTSSTASGSACTTMRRRRASASWATCRSSSRRTAPMSGRTSSSSTSTRMARPIRLRAYRLTISARRDSSGAIRSTTGRP